MLKALKNLLRLRKFRKELSCGVGILFVDISNVVNNAVFKFENQEAKQNAILKGVLLQEGFAVALWFFKGSDLFPDGIHELILDEVHQKYFDFLKKQGFKSVQVQAVCERLGDRYNLYNELFSEDKFIRIGTNFVKFVTQQSGTEIDISLALIPPEIMKGIDSVINKHKDIMNAAFK